MFPLAAKNGCKNKASQTKKGQTEKAFVPEKGCWHLSPIGGRQELERARGCQGSCEAQQRPSREGFLKEEGRRAKINHTD